MAEAVKDAIAVSDLWKSYSLGDTQVPALRGLNMTVAMGDFCALVGASGSGKSTLLNLLGALDRADRGKISIGGQDLSGLSPSQLSALRSRRIGFVFQAFHLIPVLSVLENVQLPLHLFDEMPYQEQTAAALAALNQVGLGEFAKSTPNRLSGGQRQRVAIARALVTKPAVVLADEPTANLDSVTAHAIIDLLEDLNRQNRVTFLISSHDEKLIGRVSRVLRIQDGVLV